MAEETSAPVATGPNPGLTEPFLADEAEAIAKLYRRLVLLVGGQILMSVVAQFLGALASTGAPEGVSAIVAILTMLILLAALTVVVFLVGTAYKLARRLGSGTPVLWAVAMFFPCVNIITLLVLSSKAQSWCRRHGVKVGFFGPTKESIEQLRQRSTTSVFE